MYHTFPVLLLAISKLMLDFLLFAALTIDKLQTNLHVLIMKEIEKNSN